MTFSPVKFFIFLMGLISLYISGVEYPGAFLSYLLFSAFFCGFFIWSFYLKNFFTIFMAGLLWLGFWVKSVASFIFKDGYLFEAVGNFKYSSSEWERVILVSIIGVSGFICAALIFKFFLGGGVVQLKQKYLVRKKIEIYFVILVILVIIVCAVNFNYSIYQKAGRGGVAPIFIEILIKWCLLFGLNACALTFFYNFFLSAEKKWLVYLIGVMLIDWLICLSLLSRGFFLSSGVVLFCFYWVAYKSGRCKSFYHKIAPLVVYIILALSSVLTTNYLRQLKFEGKEISVSLQNKIIKEDSLPGLQLIFGRWVGLEGVASVASSPDISPKLLIDALLEKKDLSQPSFYDRTILNIDSPYLNIGEKSHYAINLPGIVGFSYYSGSLFFVFISCLIAGLLALLLEKIALIISLGNAMFSGFVAYLVAYRYVSFGYAPSDSYMFVSSLIFTVVLIGLLQKWLIKK